MRTFETETSRRTELLIVLTPHVVSSNDSPELPNRTQDLINALPLSPEVIEQIRRGQLEGDPNGAAAAFEPIEIAPESSEDN